MRHSLIRIAVFCAAALALTASAADGRLVVSDPYVRLGPPGSPASAAYLMIRNPGVSDRRLVKAASPIAKSVELHEHRNENGVMRMREVKGIAVKAGGETALEPGGYHLMLIGVERALREGESVPITLRFDDGSIKEISARVRRIETTMPADPAMKSGAMKH